MEEKLKQIVCKTIDEHQNDLHSISKDIWSHPELGYKEVYAHQRLSSYLEQKGFAVKKQFPLETSFVARYGDPAGLKIGVICEFDALPGVDHACGHNLIAESGIAAGLAKRLWQWGVRGDDEEWSTIFEHVVMKGSCKKT